MREQDLQLLHATGVGALHAELEATDLHTFAASRQVPEVVSHLANGLADRLDTRVQVSIGARRGKLTIEFADAADLDRIMSILDGKS